MKLKSFTVERYRSITTAKRIQLGKSTILVGPNNEGKSNILRALVLAMGVLTRGRQIKMVGARRRVIYRHLGYVWELDFPVNLQIKHPRGESVMVLDFDLTEEDREEFYDAVQSRIKGSLPLRIAIGKEGIKVTFYKQGKGSGRLSRKSDRVAEFVSERLEFEHIQAIRTAKSAQAIVEEMVGRELAELEDDPAYQEALNKIKELQDPVLRALSSSIHRTLTQFLPQIKEVEVRIQASERSRALRHIAEIIVDDGTPTPLSYKGDGAQSLVAIGIIRHASEKGAKGKNFVIAIEEPESHLHPFAIHELKAVIDDLSDQHQIILTTHNPVFVDRRVVGNNIIVKSRRARPARSVEEIREILGVRASDNLRHAELVLIVEGDDDQMAMRSLLDHHSTYLSEALNNGTLAIDPLGGASNLNYKITLLRDCICLYHVFLDNDKAGQDAYEKAKNRGILQDAEVNLARCAGLSESELEDLYDLSCYKDILASRYRVSLQSPKFRTKKKWTDRVKDCFEQQGKPWNDAVERELKYYVARAVAEEPGNALNSYKKPVLDALIFVLESRLKEKEKAGQVITAEF